MKKWILALAVLALVGCLTNSNDSGTKVLGYSTGLSGTTLGKANGHDVWALTKTRGGNDSFFVYVKIEDINKRPGFTKSGIFRALGSGFVKAEILDAGNQCLTIHQTGKDTVVIEGVTAIVDVPIEPCMPYLLDKDLP